MSLIPFSFEANEVRVVDHDGEALFVASDVAAALGYANTRAAISRHCKGVTKRDIPTTGGMQTFSVIREPDVYRLIVKSKMPSAERFEAWVFEEVLPAIRKTGEYSLQAKPTTALDVVEGMVAALKEQDQRVRQLEGKVDAIMRGEAFFTVVGYANKLGKRLDQQRTAKIGKMATKICEREGIEKGRAPHPLFGEVNTYPEEVLALAFDIA